VSVDTNLPRLVRQNGPVSTTFPRTRRSQRGYNVEQVEDFLEDARRAYATPPGEPVGVSAESIRHTAFSLQRAGYSPSHVDAALERLEDAFATREREQALLTAGDEAWYSQARQIAQEIVDRLSRPALHRFARAGILTDGYDRKEVDAFANRLLKYFEDRLVMTVDEVRTVAFRPRKHGYREAQVDLLLDSAIKVMQAVQ
jgi:DivIVA domain-containing protein